MEILKVGLNDSNQRIDKFIFKTFPKFSKSAVYKAIRTKKIKVKWKTCWNKPYFKNRRLEFLFMDLITLLIKKRLINVWLYLNKNLAL